MNSKSAISEFVIARFDQFLERASSDHPEVVSEVYVACLTKTSVSHTKNLDLGFSWNIESAWDEHKSRPSNTDLPFSAKWDPQQWIWYENHPHEEYHSLTLFEGDDFYDHSTERERELEEAFYNEYPGDLFESHIVFVDSVFSSVAQRFRKHPLMQQHGISNIPILLSVPGCPNYGEEYWDIWHKWNPDGFPEESNYK